MKSKIILIASSVIVSALYVSQIHAAVSSVKSSLIPLNSAAPSNNTLGGVVSKIADDKIEINAVTYSFSPNQAKIYDLNGKLNRNAKITAGMFVQCVLKSGKPKTRITELRIIRK